MGLQLTAAAVAEVQEGNRLDFLKGCVVRRPEPTPGEVEAEAGVGAGVEQVGIVRLKVGVSEVEAVRMKMGNLPVKVAHEKSAVEWEGDTR